MESLIGIDFEANTLKGYHTNINHLKGYIKTKGCKPNCRTETKKRICHSEHSEES
jgi:hypothetical protein